MAQFQTDLKKVSTGLLSPTGEFYTCSYTGHDFLAVQLGFESSWAAIMKGWLRFHEGTFTDYTDYCTKFGYNIPEITQGQIDAIFDWSLAQEGRFLPAWLKALKP